MGDFGIVFFGKLVNGQKTLVGIETEMLIVVIGEIERVVAIADNKELHKTKRYLAIERKLEHEIEMSMNGPKEKRMHHEEEEEQTPLCSCCSCSVS